MMKQKLLLAAFVLFMSTIAAHAQTGSFCYYQPQGNTDQTLTYLQQGPTFGFKAYSCPYPPVYAEFLITRYWHWTSTCPQGGIIIQGVSIDSYDTQINVDSYIFDPNTGRMLGELRGFAYVLITPVGGLPQFIETADVGNKCNPYARDNLYQSNATPE